MQLDGHLNGYARVHTADAVAVGWCEHVTVGAVDFLCVQQPGNHVDWFALTAVRRITALSEDQYRMEMNRGTTPAQVLAFVAEHFAVPAARLQSDCRDSATTLPRFFLYKLCAETLPHPHNRMCAIGRFIGRDHGAVSSGIKRLEGLLQTEPKTAARYEDMRRALQTTGTEELSP